jgi:16S rRNA G966 N2-methylase RsmD
MVEAIAIEADRCRQSVENIVKHAVFEILHAPDHFSNTDSISLIHLFTLGSSSATYEALSQLGTSFFLCFSIPYILFFTS